IWTNPALPGHLGSERVTVQNLQILQVREAEKLLLVSGAVPGTNGGYVIVRPAIKHPERVLATHAAHRKHDEQEAAKKPAITVREDMSAKVLSKTAAKEARIDIIEDGRGSQAVQDVVVAMRAARRSGSANTKTKAE